MDETTFSGLAGLFLSLGFSFIPGLSTWYEKLDGTQKRSVMAAVLVVTAIAIFALSCASVLTVVTCDRAGGWQMVEIFFTALVVNQSTHRITPKAAEISKAWTLLLEKLSGGK